MKTKFILLCFFATITSLCIAQNIAINTTGSSADASAILDVSSFNKGILIPRMMPWDRTNIQNPANGLLVFDLVSNSFWYYSNGWQEIGSGGGSMSGPAGGDLSGEYPTPNVAKLQNLDVAFGVPFDKQVLKWDALSNNWKGRNDSLFLPYNATSGSVTSLFGITNNNSFPGATAIHGKRGAGSGLAPAATMGIWGDNSNGLGVLGTSNAGVGVYGLSNNNHGVYGYSTSADFAGVKGQNATDNGIGVMGEIGQTGLGVYGKGTGINSIAGRFENTSPDNTYMALDARNLGLGAAGTFWTSNPDNPSPTLMVSSHSSGHGIFALHDSIGTDNSAIRGWHLGAGEGIYAKSNEGDAGKLIIDNFFSEGNALYASTIGNGGAGVFVKNHVFGETEGDPAVLIDNFSKAPGLKVRSTYASATTAAIDVEYEGYAYAVDINTTRGGLRSVTPHQNNYAIYGDNSGSQGTAIRGTANGYAGIGIHGSSSAHSGIGVLGINTNTIGPGVRGENNSSGEGAVEGINTGGGGGVRGINASGFGYGVIGDAGDQHGIAGRFNSTNPISEVSPAIWAYVTSLSNGMDITLYNESNQNTALNVIHHGQGELAHFEGSGDAEVTMANNGNISTTGTITVKTNKGIIRNSSSSQKRMETRDVQLVHFSMPVGAMVSANVTFSQAFSSAPIVSIGNINSGFTGPCEKMTIQVKNVTTTGCTVTMYNPGVSGNPDVSGTWNLLAIGNE